MPKYAQGPFYPKNPKKYIGKGTIRLRSSWEFAFANFCDNNENVLEWSSESIRIPYRNPLTGKSTTYVPDFLIRYRDKNSKIVVELIEVKPYKQSVVEGKMNANLRATVAINRAKWKMAAAWCKKQGIKFRVVTENEIYRK